MLNNQSLIIAIMMVFGISASLKAECKDRCGSDFVTRPGPPDYVQQPGCDQPPEYVEPPEYIESPQEPPYVDPPIYEQPPGSPCKLGVTGTMTSRGLVVQAVEQGSLAHRAGVRPGDLIRKINGIFITNRSFLQQAMHSASQFGSLHLIVQRVDMYNNRFNIQLSTFIRTGPIQPQGVSENF